MSDDLHRTRLWWCAAQGRGIAKHAGVTVELTQRPPVLLALGRLIEIEYAPLVGFRQYQLATGAREDMRDVHMAECLAFLRFVAEAKRDAIETWRPG